MRTRGTHTFYQVRIGADARPAADDLCNRIRGAGGACFVLREHRRAGVTQDSWRHCEEPPGRRECAPDDRLRDRSIHLFRCDGLLRFAPMTPGSLSAPLHHIP